MTDTNTAHFAPTNLVISMDRGPSRLVSIPSTEAKTWDGAGETTNATIYSDAHGVHCYAEIKITGRGPRRHAFVGGVWGWAARARFTHTDDTGEWFAAVVHSVG